MIVLTGILGAMAAARFADNAAFNTRNFTDQSKALLRYGQKVAVAQNRAVYVRLNGSSIALCFDFACNNHVTAPSNANSGASTTVAQCSSTNWACEAPPSGVTYSATSSAFYFDELGRPCNTSDSLTSPTSSFTALTVTIAGDTAGHSVTVEAETGYVH